MIRKINIPKLRYSAIYFCSASRLLWLALLLFGILSSCIYLKYTCLQASKLVQLQNQEPELKRSLVAKQRLVKSLDLYQHHSFALNQLAKKIQACFPSAAYLPNVLLEINQLAEDSNVTIASFIPKDITLMKLAEMPHKGGKILAENFVLNGVASYANLVSFIYRIGQLSWLVEITNLQFIRVDDERVNLSFNLVIFYSSE